MLASRGVSKWQSANRPRCPVGICQRRKPYLHLHERLHVRPPMRMMWLSGSPVQQGHIMRCAIYARFSSDLQDAQSIADQTALCRARAAREGWSVVEEFSDAAISGATSIDRRPGLTNLMSAAAEGRLAILLTKSIDRLSRDLEHIAGLHKRMRFLGVKIVTISDGEIGKLHVAMRGLVSDLYLDDLAQKTRRGQMGRVQAGDPGGRCYGYQVREGADAASARLTRLRLRSCIAFFASTFPESHRSLSSHR